MACGRQGTTPAGIPLESMSPLPGDEAGSFVGMVVGVLGLNAAIFPQTNGSLFKHYPRSSENILDEREATHSPGGGRGGGAGQRHHLLDGQPELEPV